jgi:uncharacterized protein
MKDLIEHIAKSLVDIPEEVVVGEVVGEATYIYEIRVADGDLGKIIGKHGQTIRAIRTIMSGVAAKEHKRITLELIE